MKRSQIILGLFGLAGILFLIFSSTLRSMFYHAIASGSVSKTQALNTGCNKINTICILKDGKVTAQKASVEDKTTQTPQTEKAQRIQYAINVAKSVRAIRAYTHIPDLDLSLLEGSTPRGISYYCTTDLKCWAVDNQSYTVIPGKK